MYKDEKYIDFKNRIKEVEEIFKDINFEEINEAGPRISGENITKQFNIINNEKKPVELYYKLVEFMDPKNKDMVLTSKYGKVEQFLSKKRFDEVAIECFIMERLLEFGMFSDLYAHEFKDLAPMPKLISDCVHCGLLGTLRHLFDSSDKIRNEMIATFFNYSYCIPEITDKFKNDNISCLDYTKEKLERSYYNLLIYKKKERDNKYNKILEKSNSKK